MELGMCHSVTELSVRFPTHSRCWWTEYWSSSWFSIWNTYFLLIVVSHGREYDSNYRGPQTVIGCILLRTSKFLLFCVFGC